MSLSFNTTFNNTSLTCTLQGDNVTTICQGTVAVVQSSPDWYLILLVIIAVLLALLVIKNYAEIILS